MKKDLVELGSFLPGDVYLVHSSTSRWSNLGDLPVRLPVQKEHRPVTPLRPVLLRISRTQGRHRLGRSEVERFNLFTEEYPEMRKQEPRGADATKGGGKMREDAGANPGEAL